MTKLGVKNSRQQVTQATGYSICKFKHWKFPHVAILAPSVSRWLPEFSKIFAPLKDETDLLY